MIQPVFGQKTLLHSIIFWSDLLFTAIYSLIAVILGILYTVKSHYQLFFILIAIAGLDIAIIFVLFMWKRGDLDNVVVSVPLILTGALIFAGITTFTTLKIPGDACVDCDGICKPNSNICIQCEGKYVSYRAIMDGSDNYTCIPKPTSNSQKKEKKMTRFEQLLGRVEEPLVET
ncbi:MAG: hypothetical protein EZS28_004046 [Streblomastix strix]|uniref:Uncharacterized protein n=1 Tax=Streblomastix strix TaxID=222440 RepID=A0A5J4WZS2_9EUKA|nr:MAG: hypothetical protein EZS28_004046 [Streblomastix strix]